MRGHGILSRQLLDGLSLYWENSQLFVTRQWLKLHPSLPVAMSPTVTWEQNFHFFSLNGICHFSILLAEPSLITGERDKLFLLDLSLLLESIALNNLFFVINNPILLTFFVRDLCETQMFSAFLNLISRNKGPTLGTLSWKSRPQLYCSEDLLNVM